MKNITIKQLRAFSAVAQARSFTRAASRLNLSQSALTIAIQQLEAEAGVKLFDRTTRSVHLTDAGAQFLPVADGLLAQLSRSLDDLSAVAGRERGRVVAAASASFLQGVLAPSAARMRARFPGIDVKLLNMPDNLARRVLEEEIDFGITNVSALPHGLESFPLLEDLFVLLCPADHPLAGAAGPLDWDALAGHAFVTMPVGTQMREIMDAHPDVSRIVGAPACETSSIFALGALIRARLGIAAVPAEGARAILSDDLVQRPLRGPELRRGLSLVKRRNRSLSPAARELVREMTDLVFTSDIAGDRGLVELLADRESFLGNFV